MLKSHSSLIDMSALPVPLPLMSRSLEVIDLCGSNRAGRAVSLKESHLVKVIHMHIQPSVEAYGEMTSPYECERVGTLIQDFFDWRFVEVRTADAAFRVGLTGAG